MALPAGVETGELENVIQSTQMLSWSYSMSWPMLSHPGIVIVCDSGGLHGVSTDGLNCQYATASGVKALNGKEQTQCIKGDNMIKQKGGARWQN